MRPEWCPALHTIQGNDPSGPMLVDGVWHMFVTCDDGPSWGHFSSPDLVHWTRQPPTDWDSATGTVSPAAGGGFVAFWPNTTTPYAMYYIYVVLCVYMYFTYTYIFLFIFIHVSRYCLYIFTDLGIDFHIFS